MKKYRKAKLPVLDEIDTNIIMELQKDARESYLSIAQKIGVSEGTVRNRVTLELKRGIIKLKAAVDPTKLGFDFTCIIGLEIAIEKLREAGNALAANPNVYLLVGCTGNFDIIAFLIFKNTTEFEKCLRDQIAKLPGIIRSHTFVNTSLMKIPWNDDIALKKLLEL